MLTLTRDQQRSSKQDKNYNYCTIFFYIKLNFLSVLLNFPKVKHLYPLENTVFFSGEHIFKISFVNMSEYLIV